MVSVALPRNNASGAQSITASSLGFSVLIGMVACPQKVAAAGPARAHGSLDDFGEDTGRFSRGPGSSVPLS